MHTVVTDCRAGINRASVSVKPIPGYAMDYREANPMTRADYDAEGYALILTIYKTEFSGEFNQAETVPN